ncbi:MAG TPA: c-type cytochrome [Chloroflexota bacterium]
MLVSNTVRLAWLVAVAVLVAGCAAPSPNGATTARATDDAANGTVGASRGRQLFVSRNCGACHTIEGVQGATGTVGPNLSDAASVAGQRKPGVSPEEYLRESITAPDAYVVQGFQGGIMPKLPLTDREVDDLVAFLMTRR